MTYISKEIREQVATLDDRSKTLARIGIKSFSAALTLGSGVVATWIFSLYLGPDAYPSYIDVPAKLIQIFSPQGSSSVEFRSMTETLGDSLPGLQPIALSFGLIMMVIAGGLAIFNGSIDKLAQWAISTGLAISIMGVLAGFASDVSRPENDLAKAVKDRDYSVIKYHLEDKKLDKSPMGQYVLAQASIANKNNAMPINDDLVAAINSPSAGFTPKEEALYAIEHAAYGEPKSPAAVSYQRESLKRQGRWQIVSKIIGGLFVAVGLVTAGAFGLRHVLRQRLARIKGLMSLDTDVSSSKA